MRLLAISLIGILICGCGSSETKTNPPATDSAQPSEPVAAEDTKLKTSAAASEPVSDVKFSDLVGRITLNGQIPPPRKLTVNKDVEVCGAVDTVEDIVGSDGGVANVVIEVIGVEESGDWQWQEPQAGYVIRQKKCRFLPNMLVIPKGKQISVYNDDPVGHNVNTGGWNQMQPPGPDPIVRPVESKAPIKIGCNIHSWMEGWIYPAQSPFYAVTKADGEYSIKAIPPGKYRVVIWHAFLGRQRERITLDAGKVSKLNHVFEARF